MFASLVNSPRAVQMNVLIIRSFVRMRGILACQKELATPINRLGLRSGEGASVLSSLAREIGKIQSQSGEPVPAKPKRPILYFPG